MKKNIIYLNRVTCWASFLSPTYRAQSVMERVSNPLRHSCLDAVLVSANPKFRNLLII